MNDYELFERISDLEKKYMFFISNPAHDLAKAMSLLKDYNELIADIVEPKMAEIREKLYAQQFRDGKISWEQLKEKLNITVNPSVKPKVYKTHLSRDDRTFFKDPTVSQQAAEWKKDNLS